MFLLIFSVPFSGFYSDLFKFRPRECKLYRAKNCKIVSSSLWFRTGKGTFGVEKERKKERWMYNSLDICTFSLSNLHQIYFKQKVTLENP